MLMLLLCASCDLICLRSKNFCNTIKWKLKNKSVEIVWLEVVFGLVALEDKYLMLHSADGCNHEFKLDAFIPKPWTCGL